MDRACSAMLNKTLVRPLGGKGTLKTKELM
jgi:hypothetical protein